MAVSAEYKSFVKEILEPLGEIRIRNMFGGAGVYYGDVMFGLIAAEVLYFKADDSNRALFEEEGMGPFVFEPENGRPVKMSYWELPDRLYDEPDELMDWAKAVIEVAVQTKKKKPVRKRKPASKTTAKKTKK